MKAYRTYRIYDADNQTLAIMECYYNETDADIQRLLLGLHDLYATMEGYEQISKGYQETYYDGPEDNLHYINER